MKFFKGAMSGLAAILLALMAPLILPAIRSGNNTISIRLETIERAFVSPGFWLVAIGLFALFFVASRARNRVLQIFGFWIPTLIVVAIGLTLTAVVAYVVMHARQG